MASSSSAAGPSEAGPSEARPPIFVPTGQVLLMYDSKKGDKTNLLKDSFRGVPGGCSVEGPLTTIKGKELGGFALLKLNKADQAFSFKTKWHEQKIGDIIVKTRDFDSKKEVYVGLFAKKDSGDVYLKVKRLEWVEKDEKLEMSWPA